MSETTTHRPSFNVRSSSDTKKLATAVAKAVRDDGYYPSLCAVGAGAVSQAAKAIAIASTYLVEVHIALASTVLPETTPDARKGGDAMLSRIVFMTFDATGANHGR